MALRGAARRRRRGNRVRLDPKVLRTAAVHRWRWFHNGRRWCSLARVYPTTSPSRGLTRRTALAALGLGAGTVALTAAGCESGPKQIAKPTAATVAKDPLGPIYTETMTLITTYDTAITNNPALVTLLGPLRDDHRQHVVALAALMGIAAPAISPGPNPSGAPMPPIPTPTAASTVAPSSGPPSSPSSPGTGSVPTPSSAPAPTPVTPPGPETAPARALLSAAEKTAASNASNACITAVPAERVAVLASIAACRATHVVALR